MPDRYEAVISRPGRGDVTDGSVDYYEMEWEIVRGPGPGPADGREPDSRDRQQRRETDGG